MSAFTNPAYLVSSLVRAMLVVLMLAAPVLAVPAAQSFGENFIEAPKPKAKGIGFVLVVMLKRV